MALCLWRQHGEVLRSKFLGSAVFIQILTLLIVSSTSWANYPPVSPVSTHASGENVH